LLQDNYGVSLMYCLCDSGGTASDAVILNKSGEVVGKNSGPGSNPWVS